MRAVTLKLKPQGKPIVYREIDITNICYSRGENWQVAYSREHQKELLENWINERGNEQHNTILKLVDWWIS